MENELSFQYFEWITNIIFMDPVEKDAYIELLQIMHSIPFQWHLEKDENRQKDAQDLRYTFGYIYGYSETEICQNLDIVPPSLLEVIVALINRVQDSILYDPNNQNHNQDIFIDILTSLKIAQFRGKLFSNDITIIYNAIERYYSCDYDYNGYGGLFTVSNPKNDMRDTEIWFQFMWYLDEKQGGKYL